MNTSGVAPRDSASHFAIANMATRTATLATLIILAVFSTGVQAVDRDVVVGGNVRFAFDLYQQLKADRNGENIFMSPFSVSAVLAITYTGARGETERQMAKTLHFALPPQRLLPAFAQLQDDLQRSNSYELAIANRLWGQKGYPFLKDFLNLVDANYPRSFGDVDFRGNPQGSRKTINRWVDENTNGKIKDLLRPSDIGVLSRLVLTNAIYFKGSWVSPFDPDYTVEKPFWLVDGNIVATRLMSQTGQFKYLDAETHELLELPYAGDRLSMVVLSPRRGIKLELVEQILTAENLHTWRSAMKETVVSIFLPQFETLTRFGLNDSLVALGMKNAFADPADFSGIAGKNDLYISKVIHEAFVKVNEEGTEATASTAAATAVRGPKRRELIFRADHPFVFVILDKQSGSILFLGRLMNPTKR